MTDTSSCLFVFIDESGNLDFSPRGTHHFVLAAAISQDPVACSSVVSSLKYDLLVEGMNIPYFHASENSQYVRNRFLNAIQSLNGMSGHTFVVNKADLPSRYRDSVALYLLVSRQLAIVLSEEVRHRLAARVIVVFDKALTHRHQEAFSAELKPMLNRWQVPYRLYFHSVKYDPHGQVADYLAWARYVAVERKELRPLQALGHREKSTTLVNPRGPRSRKK